MDTSRYPFDKQSYSIVCRSGVMQPSVRMVLGENARFAKEEIIGQREWEIMGIETTIGYAEDGSDRITNFAVTLTFAHGADLILLTALLPLIILSYMNVCVFLVPVQTNEKGSMAVTMYISYGFFVSYFGTILPSSSIQIPTILYYLFALLIFSALTMLYVIVECRICTYAADVPFHWHKCRRLLSIIWKSEWDEVVAEKDVQDDEEVKTDDPLTCSVVMRKIDIAVFFISLFVITCGTSAFFKAL